MSVRNLSLEGILSISMRSFMSAFSFRTLFRHSVCSIQLAVSSLPTSECPMWNPRLLSLRISIPNMSAMASLWLKNVLSDNGAPVSFSGLRLHASLISLKET